MSQIQQNVLLAGRVRYSVHSMQLNYDTDGREVPLAELNIVKGNAVPKLQGEAKLMRKTKKTANIYLEGSLQ